MLETVDDEPSDPYDVSILALRPKTISLVSSLLNPVKVIPTEWKIPRDWHGLAELIGIGGERMPHLQSDPDPTLKVLQIWCEQSKDSSTIGNLIRLLEEIDRFDVIDDVIELIDVDITLYKDKISRNEVSPLTEEADRNILTVDDINRINQGLDPQKYDAFLLFADEDIDFATQLIETLEKQRNLKLCVKDRDLVGGALEHEVIIKLIAERCNRLLVIFSPAFFSSPANKFFLKATHAIGIGRETRKIIPCIYTRCEIPPEFIGYFMLDYQRSSKLWNFWDTLYKSLLTTDLEPGKKSNLNRCDSSSSPSLVLQDHIVSVSHQVRSDDGIRPVLRRPKDSDRFCSLRPKKEGVSFNSMVDLSTAEEEKPQLNSSASLSTVREHDEKKQKPKSNWLRKILKKKTFWQKHSKQKVAAVAN